MAVLSIRVIPRARKSVVAGRRGDAVLVRLMTPPVEGAANQELIDLLSRVFGVPRRNISIVAGARSRDKRVTIEGLSEPELAARLSAILSQ